MDLFFEKSVWSSYAFYSSLVMIKVLMMSPLTAMLRVKTKTWASSEDASFFSSTFTDAKSEEVERVRQAHRNDLESIVPFLLIGLFYCLVGPPPEQARIVFRNYVVARYMHTFTYLGGFSHTWRAVSWALSYGITLLMASYVLYFAWDV